MHQILVCAVSGDGSEELCIGSGNRCCLLQVYMESAFNGRMDGELSGKSKWETRRMDA